MPSPHRVLPKRRPAPPYPLACPNRSRVYTAAQNGGARLPADARFALTNHGFYRWQPRLTAGKRRYQKRQLGFRWLIPPVLLDIQRRRPWREATVWARSAAMQRITRKETKP